MKTTNNTKTISKSDARIVEQVIKLKNKAKKETLSGFDLQKLTNAVYKIEAKSISHVYKQIKALHVDKGELGELVRALAGKTLPSFKAFADGFKGAPCLWFGFATLRKLNPKFQIEAKVKRQNKSEAKK
tara:strand:- start:542 stop:928 length:387 start_codon:yes stop_codon:yes gene_type:complete